MAKNRPCSFNSLQTGRHIQTQDLRHFPVKFLCFNSLQTGRHIQTKMRVILLPWNRGTVSIPFKREGTVRHEAAGTATHRRRPMFPFPSNGKAQSDGEIRQINVEVEVSFHSLQTGRHSQTSEPPSEDLRTELLVSIPFKREGTVRRRDPSNQR